MTSRQYVWAIAAAVGPGRPPRPVGALAVALIVVEVVVIGAVLGVFGGMLGYVVRRSLQTDIPYHRERQGNDKSV